MKNGMSFVESLEQFVLGLGPRPKLRIFVYQVANPANFLEEC